MKILDTTLRDGSYVIDFQFTSAQTSHISKILDSANVPLIEVGHGVGLNASQIGHGDAAESDVAYMKAAAEVVKNGAWGMFAIPGICDLDHLNACFDYNMGFIRIGVTVDGVDQAKPFVERAKKNGMFVAVNFMKSNTKDPIEFELASRKAISFGADVIYIVDSAGNMTPDQVRKYCERLSDIEFGFHGHNNLGLAMANAIVAKDAGASIIDTSLQGMGRCTGNTMTEHFVGLMQRENQLEDIDLFALLNLGETEIRPLIHQTGHSSVDLICGLAGFHSSYMNVIRSTAQNYEIDPRRLIEAVCRVDKHNAAEDLVETQAKIVLQKYGKLKGQFNFKLDRYFGDEQRDL